MKKWALYGLLITGNYGYADFKSKLEASNRLLKSTIGHNPSLAVHNYDPQTFNTQKTVTIFLHGWGNDRHEAEEWSLRFGQDPVIGFNFIDHSIKRYGPFGALFKSNLAQEGDVKTFLYVLRECVNQGARTVNVYGHSRGGGTAINALAYLNKPNDPMFDKLRKEVKFTDEERMLILNAVQNGWLLINCPFISLQHVVAKRPWLKSVISYFSKHDSNSRLYPLYSVDLLDGLCLKVLLHYQHPDRTVGNLHDSYFFDRLRKSNQQGITCLSLGNDGGHNYGHISLFGSLQVFNYFKKLEAPTDCILMPLGKKGSRMILKTVALNKETQEPSAPIIESFYK